MSSLGRSFSGSFQVCIDDPSFRFILTTAVRISVPGTVHILVRLLDRSEQYPSQSNVWCVFGIGHECIVVRLESNFMDQQSFDGPMVGSSARHVWIRSFLLDCYAYPLLHKCKWPLIPSRSTSVTIVHRPGN